MLTQKHEVYLMPILKYCTNHQNMKEHYFFFYIQIDNTCLSHKEKSMNAKRVFLLLSNQYLYVVMQVVYLKSNFISFYLFIYFSPQILPFLKYSMQGRKENH